MESMSSANVKTRKVVDFLREKCHFSNYQIAQFEYLCKSTFSEVSKLLIMGIFFRQHLPLYFFALFILICLRSTTGGLHFYTYMGCFLTTFGYFALAIYILPQISLPVHLEIVFLIASIAVCYRIGLVTSKYRPEQSDMKRQVCRLLSCVFIILYGILLCVIPENNYLTVGFWVIILHALQLVVAKYKRRKETELNVV